MTGHDKTFRAITVCKAHGEHIVAFKQFCANVKEIPVGDFDWRTINRDDVMLGFFIGRGVHPLQASYIVNVCKNDLGIWL